MPTPTIPAGNLFMNATTYTGNGTSSGSTQTITNGAAGQAFQPDLVWLKSRSDVQNHNLTDSVRGISGTGSPILFSDTNSAETTYTGYGVSALNSNGFTLIGNGGLTNNNGFTYVGWQWKAGGTAVSNTTGSITSSVSANTTSGFSIVTYTGNGTGGATIGHGLGAAPELMIFKGRNTGTDGLTWFRAYNTNQGQMLLDSTATIYNPGNGLYFNSTYPSSTVTTLGTSGAINGSGITYVAYMWTPIAGYSSFGSYVGNGSSDGPFIYTGFRPRWVMIKLSSNQINAASWCIWDTSRSQYNLTSQYLVANTSAAQDSDTSYTAIDILSNGIKIRSVNTYGINQNGATYVYAAFAENPFKYANAR
jgi:hypothetical protein